MAGASALTIERVLREAVTDVGVPSSLVLPLAAWTLNTSVVLAAVGAGIVGNAAAATSLNCIQWDDTADASDIISTQITLPGDFRGSVGGIAPVLKLYIKARVLDGTGSATANADLALTVQCFWHGEGDTALSTLGTAITCTAMAVDYAAAAEEGFAWYEANIGGAMTADQLLALAAWDTFKIQVYPNETVGTNLYIEMLGAAIVYDRHARVPAAQLTAIA